MSQNNNQTKKSKSNLVKVLGIALPIFIILVVVIVLKNANSQTGKASDNKNTLPVTKDSDLIINVKDVTDKANFYPVEINGTKMEIIAVKASDGTIRTSFNTCQVCYSSGKGYYVQEGNQLVCQNCGNRFGMDDVEVTKGGCNPVPITSDYKKVNDTNITISKDILAKASVIFENWKNQ